MKYIFLSLLLATNLAHASQKSLNECIAAWGNSPFKKDTPPNKVLKVGVKVFGIGAKDIDNTKTSEPSLILVRPNINVMGKTTLSLMNPNGWYCFESNVNVMGKLNIEADCSAKIASAIEGANVMAANDAGADGVSVMGSIRIQRLNCKK